ncbi:DUF4097 family beta strand repeat-containing protein [Pontibacter flavimaris]|uniref:Adhesin domain-containing protein n=1 Tax=Pontibacter flavimaris TaxID=1797110 RepID=A0A1Q5PA47_9BACT|nr:DUF4097 family beta strand repeat-containing protein [Pontibacter flavimaris]OKL39087.1 hypothetical protein A3841_03825 [Pontibacter flavimaris]
MYNALRLTLVLLLAPMLATAQAKDSAPCPDVTVDLSGLRVLEDMKLENLADLKELKSLAALESLSELKHLAEMKHLVITDQTGTTGNLETEAAMFDAEKRKTIDKTFKVSSKDALNIENQWGQVHVNTWDKKEIRVKVEVIARAVTDERAQMMLDNVTIKESHEGSTYSFRTEKSPMRINGHNNRSLEINYTIYMPAENALAVQNKFGDVYLASMKGKVDIDMQYGNLKCDRLANASNNVKLTYGSGNCAYINGGIIRVAYADMKVGEAGGLQGSSQYGDFSLGSLQETMDMKVQYGSFRIDNISNNIRKISLDSGFTPLNLNFADNTNFNFDVNVQFGNFNVDKSLVTITSLEKDYTSAEYKGRFGGASPKGVVSITSKYGDVKFTK